MGSTAAEIAWRTERVTHHRHRTLESQRPNQQGRQRLLRDNVFVERLWRSLKYESVYLNTSTAVEPGVESPPAAPGTG
jgi:hypothetical protein